MEQKNLEMTEEVRKKLSSFLAITPDATFKYTPQAFKILPPKFWPIFTLRYMDGIELAEFEGQSGFIVHSEKGREFHGTPGKYRIALLKKGIEAWKNYFDKSGKEIVFQGEESIKVLPPDLQNDLMNAITEQTELSEEELRSLE